MDNPHAATAIPPAPLHADTTHEFSSEKTITTTPEVFQYLERFGRRHYPLVQQLRKDTLEKRQETIRFLLEPTTCSLLEQQLRLSAGVRVLEVGVFTGVTSLALAHNVVVNYNKIVAKQQQQTAQQQQNQQNQQQQLLDTTSLPNHISGLAAQLSEQQKQKVFLKKKEYESNKNKIRKNYTTYDDGHHHHGQYDVTDLDVMFYDADVTIRHLREQQQQWNDENNNKKNNNNNNNNNNSKLQPLVIGLDFDHHTFQEVALPIFQEANMMGTPYVFLDGDALDVLAKLTCAAREDKEENEQQQHHHQQQKQQNTNPFQNSFDFIFIDADKKNYLNYYEYCLQLIKPETGLICIDNVLWKGGVVAHADSSPASSQKEEEHDNAKILHDFNAFIHNDPRVDALILPLGDGLTIVRKVA